MKYPLTLLLIALCIPLILSACQTPTTEPTTFTHPSQIQGWEMEGKLGYRTPNDGGSATFEWRQQPARGEIRFSGPLGFGSADLRWDTGRAELITAKEQYQARSPGELAWHLTGVWLFGWSFVSPHSRFNVTTTKVYTLYVIFKLIVVHIK